MSILYIGGTAVFGLVLGWWTSRQTTHYLTSGQNSESYNHHFWPWSLLSAIVLTFTAATTLSHREWILIVPFCAVLMILTIWDCRHLILPDRILLPAILVAAIVRVFFHPLPYLNYVIAAGFGAGLLYAIKLISRGITGRNSIGDGDIKLLLFTGLVLGYRMTFLSLFLICLGAFVLGLFMLPFLLKKKAKMLPFGPVIAAASITSFCWSDQLSFMKLGSFLFLSP
ncbi:prepilin peptidase [Paenibacillus sp. D51F]